MRALRKSLDDYLAVRRALGFKLQRPEKLLGQFLAFLEERGEERLTTAAAIAWATQPADAHQSWLSYRLSAVRGFAAYVSTTDPTTEVPAADLLPWRRCRATPYLYSVDEISAGPSQKI